MYTFILSHNMVWYYGITVRRRNFWSELSMRDCILAVSVPYRRIPRSYTPDFVFVQEYEHFYMGRM
jgi:hypothetical protein